MTVTGLIRITAPHFTAGAVLYAGVVQEPAAPIIRWMAGWGLSDVRFYCQSKGWRLEVLESP